MKLLSHDKNHFETTHRRWLEKRNRKQEGSDYKYEWGSQQCFNCRFFVPLIGVFVDDYGACTNEQSPFDKQVMFEHDGCDYHVFEENYYE